MSFNTCNNYTKSTLVVLNGELGLSNDYKTLNSLDIPVGMGFQKITITITRVKAMCILLKVWTHKN